MLVRMRSEESGKIVSGIDRRCWIESATAPSRPADYMATITLHAARPISSLSASDACRRGDIAPIQAEIGQDVVLPVEHLLTAIAWSRLDVVQARINAGVSLTTCRAVNTPGGSGTPNADTSHINTIDLSALYCAGRLKHGRCMHAMVMAARQVLSLTAEQDDQREASTDGPPKQASVCELRKRSQQRGMTRKKPATKMELRLLPLKLPVRPSPWWTLAKRHWYRPSI